MDWVWFGGAGVSAASGPQARQSEARHNTLWAGLRPGKALRRQGTLFLPHADPSCACSAPQVEARRNAAASKIAEVWRGISLSRAVVRAHREAEAARGVSSDPVGVPVGGVLPAPPQPPLLRPPSSRGSSPLPGSKPRRPSLPASGRRTPV
eukprot:355986-Chlamydomonas_euryale.AAC.26